jgi:hypothetical protein
MAGMDYGSIIEDVARRLLGEPNPTQSKPQRGILRWGNRGSLEVNTRLGVFYDHELGVGGGLVDFVAHKGGHDRAGAVEWLRRENYFGNGNGGNSSFVIDETYPYTDENGDLLYEVVRLVPKDFRQRRPHPLGWEWSLGDVRRVLYRLHDIIVDVAAGKTILVPEGERDVNNLVRLGFAATCNSGGANKWRDDISEPLRGADVVLLPDADEPGWKHVNAVGNALTGIAKSIRILILPGGHKDVSDWLAAGGTAEQLAKLVAEAPTWVSPSDAILGGLLDEAKAAAKAAEDAIIEAVAKARPGIDRAKKRKEAAKRLHVSPRDIDEELEQRWPGGERVEAPLHGHWTVDPWPDVAEGDALIRDIIRRFRRHVVFNHDVALASALWLMFSWVHDEVATHSPILNINSAEPESGKSTLMSVISFLMPRCISSVDITKAALYRSIKIWEPSFCIDEFDDTLSARGDENKQELRSVINSGHERGQGVLRCIEPDYTPQMFSTFAPKAIGMVGRKLPPATLGRCIFIEMRRKKGSELVEKFHRVDDPDLASLRSRLQRWAADNTEALRNAVPAMPGTLVNRAADNWCVLFAIADLCGGEWGDKARAAALTIEGKSDKQSIGVRALADVRRLFRARGNPDCMLSATIVAELVQDPEGPWVEYSRGKPLTQNKLAKLLGNFGVHSQNVQPEGMSQGKGYKLVWLEEVWSRYLPDEIANTGEGAL